MKLVVDANILFAAIINDGISAELIVKNDIYAPQFILDEINKHESTIRKKTNRTYEDMQMFLEILNRTINIVHKEVFEPYLNEATQISPDINDVAYIALAIKLNYPLWTNDKELKEKQSRVKIYNTKEIIELTK